MSNLIRLEISSIFFRTHFCHKVIAKPSKLYITFQNVVICRLERTYSSIVYFVIVIISNDRPLLTSTLMAIINYV